MKATRRPLSPTQELTSRLMRVVRTCPQAASEVLELVYLASRIEAATEVDRAYRDARGVISRLRNPLWEMGPADREALLAAAETIRRVCRLDEAEIPVTPVADTGERERIEARLALVLKDEMEPAAIARLTGIVAAALQD